MFSQDKDFKINVLKDEQLLNDRVWDDEKTGALIIGGGISKRELSLGLFHDLIARHSFVNILGSWPSRRKINRNNY